MAKNATDYFAGKHILITGAGSGLGLALAQALLHQGATVTATDVDPEKLAVLRKDTAHAGGLLKVASLDVRKPEDFMRCVKRITDSGSNLDILINNAGVCAAGEFVDLNDTFWTDALQINLEGTLNGCRIAANRMQVQGFGHIVNVASISGLVPFPVTAPYNVSKSGIVALSRSLRMELASRGIDVTLVCPGQLQTDMFRNLPTVNIRKAVIQANNPFVPVGIARAADIILRAVRQRKFMVVFPRYAKMLWWTHRLFPGIIERAFINKMKRFRDPDSLPKTHGH